MTEQWVSSILTGLAVIVIGYAVLQVASSVAPQFVWICYLVIVVGIAIIGIVIYEKARG